MQIKTKNIPKIEMKNYQKHLILIIIIVITQIITNTNSNKINNGSSERTLLLCDSTCKTCLNNKCQSCKEGFYLAIDYSCYKCSTINCSSCTSRTCRSCLSGYYLTNNSCTKCKDNNCDSCNNSGVCLKCKTGFDLKDFKCVSICEEGSYFNTIDKLCNKCIINSCKSCSNSSSCLTCESNYFLTNIFSTCEICPENCICKDKLGCQSCLGESTLYQGKCLNPCIDLNQDSNCTTCIGDGICLGCIDGFYLEKEKCLSCEDKFCSKCVQANNKNFCLSCKENYDLHSQFGSTMCAPKNSNCEIFNDDLSCQICDDGFYLSLTNYNVINNVENESDKCFECKLNQFSRNNICYECKDSFGACDACKQSGCVMCLANSIKNKDGFCECVDGFFLVNSDCISMVVIFVPIVSFVLICIIICFIYTFIKKRREGENYSNNRVNQIPIANNNQNNQNNENNNLKELINDDPIHGIKCINDDDNPPFWRLNCGGYLCNYCSLKVLVNLGDLNSESTRENCCTKCDKKFEYFNFVNRIIRINPELENSNDNTINTSIENYIKDINSFKEENEKCNICFFLPISKTIHCTSAIPHQLCSYCYKRLILIERINLCPFCRSEIKKL